MSFFSRKAVDMVLPAKYSKLDRQERRMAREMYMFQQKGMCYYCHACLKGNPPEDVLMKKISPDLFPENFFDHPIHLHHCHDTDSTLGAVHAFCNAVLWEHHGE